MAQPLIYQVFLFKINLGSTSPCFIVLEVSKNFFLNSIQFLCLDVRILPLAGKKFLPFRATSMK